MIIIIKVIIIVILLLLLAAAAAATSLNNLASSRELPPFFPLILYSFKMLENTDWSSLFFLWVLQQNVGILNNGKYGSKLNCSPPSSKKTSLCESPI